MVQRERPVLGHRQELSELGREVGSDIREVLYGLTDDSRTFGFYSEANQKPREHSE